MLNLLLKRWSIVLALTFLMPAAASAGVEYALLLVIVNDSISTHEVCLFNPGGTQESTSLEFDPSEPGAPSDRQEVIVGPGQTECREFVGLPGGAILKIDELPGESGGDFINTGNDILIGGTGQEPAILRKLAVQVFFKDNDGVRTGGIRLHEPFRIVKTRDTATPNL